MAKAAEKPLEEARVFQYLTEERRVENRRNELVAEGANLEVRVDALDRQMADLAEARQRCLDRLDEIDKEVSKLPAPEG